MSMLISFLVALISLFFPYCAAQANAREVYVVNAGRSTVELYWYNEEEDAFELESDPDMLPGTDMDTQTFVGHAFEIWEKPNSRGECRHAPDGECRKCFYIVTKYTEQMVTVTEDFECQFEDSNILATKKATDIVGKCRSEMKEDSDPDQEVDPMSMVNTLSECTKLGINDVLHEFQEEKYFESTLRQRMANLAHDYMCADDDIESTEPDYENDWEYETDSSDSAQSFTVQVHVEQKSAQIYVLEQFVTEEECQAILDASSDQGKVRLSLFELSLLEGGFIQNVVNRMYSYADEALEGIHFDMQGQEPLDIIRYSHATAPAENQRPDQHMAHCNDGCNGQQHQEGDGVATILMYCQVADRGGHDSFPNLGVHVKPRVGDALFVSYMDPASQLYDTGFTNHTVCPVHEGTKVVISQRIRLGVSQKTLYTHFDGTHQDVVPCPAPAV
eukprot:CAMPEP_0198144426 /NCGR_PEP_ID=MMETSP1443-20131203/15638_1 /TAXON_ID=186043 /ORGANISM="Entomoneis sp., Strain CCMP2396" /LENGTH=444 /DNA_ID=CAMNT_0043807821 /DNA_START=36 /DNA_END=1370 /DNA_ORIENTATION=-